MTGPKPANLCYTRDMELHEDARVLVEFDMASIRLMVAAAHDSDPDVWIVDPAGYERDGHVLRDNDAVRLVAYVGGSGTIYTTDGCNSCWHAPAPPLKEASPGDLRDFTARTQVPVEMLRLLAKILART